VNGVGCASNERHQEHKAVRATLSAMLVDADSQSGQLEYFLPRPSHVLTSVLRLSCLSFRLRSLDAIMFAIAAAPPILNATTSQFLLMGQSTFSKLANHPVARRHRALAFVGMTVSSTYSPVAACFARLAAVMTEPAIACCHLSIHLMSPGTLKEQRSAGLCATFALTP
jgi:hypothetical protein